MTIEQQIGQMLLFGWQGNTEAESRTVNDHASSLVAEMQVGGVILMGRNISPPDEMRQTLGQLQGLAQEHGLPPLFVATDQEGGRVSRLTPPDYTLAPAAKQIGDTRNPAEARKWARTLGLELKAVGINWDFAPVLDVNNNPDNPVIGPRSYGDDAALVAEMGVAAVHGFQDDAGILACGKHFPGHGDTDTDSHLALPRIAHERTRLEAIELVPFRAAISAGLAGIMTSHILFTAFDPALPATLSPTILTGLLRQEMGFDGLIITDCLEMRGVADGWGVAEAAVMAAIAGADVLLCCHTWQTQRAIRDALMDAVKTGRLSQARLDDATARIVHAKERWVAAP
jgi:beta-N-acetylhexosaminidase